jgi:hypothetical protein
MKRRIWGGITCPMLFLIQASSVNVGWFPCFKTWNMRESFFCSSALEGRAPRCRLEDKVRLQVHNVSLCSSLILCDDAVVYLLVSCEAGP